MSPHSVAYGSDAFGGVIAVTTRKVAPGSPLAARVSATLGEGVPERRAGADVSKGLARGSLLLAVHARQANDWHSPQSAHWYSRSVVSAFQSSRPRRTEAISSAQPCGDVASLNVTRVTGQTCRHIRQ